HLLDLVEVANGGLDLRQHVDPAGARRFLAVLERYAGAELALGDELAAAVEADLTGNEQKRADAHERDVVGDRPCGGGEHDPKLAEFLVYRAGDAALLRSWMSRFWVSRLSSPIGRRRARRPQGLGRSERPELHDVGDIPMLRCNRATQRSINMTIL